MKSFEYVECPNVRGRGFRRLGQEIGDICYYKGAVGSKVWGFTFWLTPEGEVADFAYP